MPVLIDISQTIIANLMAMEDSVNNQHDGNLLKHMVFNRIREYKIKFSNEYGPLIICCDSNHYWRKDVFPHYKANRKKDRDKSKYDWPAIFQTIKEIKQALKDNFPYKLIEVHGAEGDDIVAVLAAYTSSSNKVFGDRTLILGGDKDYASLHKFSGIHQYSPRLKNMIIIKNPEETLQRHIYKGDKSDGIPSIKSPTDFFVNDTLKRQPSIFEKEIQQWLIETPSGNVGNQDLEENYKRNQQLIDFSFIPPSLKQQIIDEYNKPINGNPGKILEYFMMNKMPNLVQFAGDY